MEERKLRYCASTSNDNCNPYTALLPYLPIQATNTWVFFSSEFIKLFQEVACFIPVMNTVQHSCYTRTSLDLLLLAPWGILMGFVQSDASLQFRTLLTLMRGKTVQTYWSDMKCVILNDASAGITLNSLCYKNIRWLK